MRVNFFSQSGTQNTGPSQGLSATVTGPLILVGNPTGPLEATPKQYVDGIVNTLNGSNIKTGTLAVARLPAFTGEVASATGSGHFTLSNSGVAAGSYTKVTVDTKGRVLAGSNITNDDIPPFSWSKINGGKPTSIEGYNITDALSKTGSTVTGSLSLNLDPTQPMHAANKQYVDSLSGGGSFIKTGAVVRRPTNITPAGFLRCNGGQVNKTTYSALFAAVKSYYVTNVNVDYTNYAALGAGQPWKQQYDINQKTMPIDLKWVNTNNAFTTPAYFLASIVTKNWVYLLGGATGSAARTHLVRMAPIKADGTLGAWVAGPAMPQELSSPTVFVTRNRVYVVGGYSNAGNSRDVFTTAINSDGTLAGWASVGRVLPDAISSGNALVTKDRVYIIGAVTDNPLQGTRIYTASIGTDGTLGAWSVANSALPDTLTYSAMAVTRNRVYLIGGRNSSNNPVGMVYTAPINSVGVIGAWTVGTAFPIALSDAQAYVSMNRVYVFGGFTNGGETAVTYSAPINADGTLGAWVQGANLPNAIYGPSLVATNSKLYLFGGNGASGVQSSVYMTDIPVVTNDYSKLYDGTINKFDGSNIAGDYTLRDDYGMVTQGAGKPWEQQYDFNFTDPGSITGWVKETSKFAVQMYQARAIITKDRVHVLGGYGRSPSAAYRSTIYTATIASDGTIGAFAASGNMPATLSEFCAITTRNRVYVIGGVGTGASSADYSTAVYTAPINADGSLGVWTSGPLLPEKCHGSGGFVLNDKLYYFPQGPNAYVAIINADGTIGDWKLHEKRSFGISESPQFAVTKNRVYLYAHGNDVSQMYVATFDDNGLLSAWTLAGNIPLGVGSTVGFATRTRVYIFGGYKSSTHYATVYAGVIRADGTIAGWIQQGNLPVAMAPSCCVVTSSKVYLFGGTTGISDFSSDSYYSGFAGGLNDYSAYYSGTISPASSTTFSLPDFSNQESASDYYFIKV